MTCDTHPVLEVSRARSSLTFFRSFCSIVDWRNSYPRSWCSQHLVVQIEKWDAGESFPSPEVWKRGRPIRKETVEREE